MKNTSCGCNCPFVKQGFCAEEKECPNYCESWWLEGEGKEPVLIKDCSPKRMLLQQQLMQHRLECVQQALCDSRNKYEELSSYLRTLIEMSRSVIFNQIEDKNDKNNHLLTHDPNAE